MEQPPPQYTYSSSDPIHQTGGSNEKATLSLVLGLVGLVFCPLILSIPAIVFGVMARGEIKERGQTNGTMATVGIVVGVLGTLWGLFFVLSVVLGVFFAETLPV